MMKKKGPRAVLALADGSVFVGKGFGYLRSGDEPGVGEAVFNTSLYGYQEVLSDPSYASQIMCFTYPHIGNVGCNPEDMESDRSYMAGVVVRNLCRVPSNFRSKETLDDFLKRQGVMGLEGIDTRALVKHLRDQGAQMAALALCSSKDEEKALVERARAAGSMEGKDLVPEVTCKEPYIWAEGTWKNPVSGAKKLSNNELLTRPHVVAIDCGIKRNILRLLIDAGFRVTVVPATHSAEDIRSLNPDALFLSNGPGDPATLSYVVENVRAFFAQLPIFGICLGHQILAQVAGGKTYKLKFGHRGGNHPVRDELTKKVEITVQNHGFAVDAESLPPGVLVSHLNLNDQTVEGLRMPGKKAFCVQYHPEASSGPHDAKYLFQRFFSLVVEGEEKCFSEEKYAEAN